MLGGCFVAVGTAAKTRSAQSNLFRVLYMGKCPFVEQSLKAWSAQKMENNLRTQAINTKF